MDNFQFNLMIQNLDNGENLNNLSLETISTYIKTINNSSLPYPKKLTYNAQLHDIFTSTSRDSKDFILIEDIASDLYKYWGIIWINSKSK